MMTNIGARLTQGQFSFLPDLTDVQITAQLNYALKQGWAIGIEYTDDPHPRNTYWEMFGNPMFDLRDAAGIVKHIGECRKTFSSHYVRVTAFDATRGWETPRMSFIVHRPAKEPGFGLARTETEGRNIRYRISSYATDRPEGERYE
jgi:ribulose-bisphosphate carboxylase small chain